MNKVIQNNCPIQITIDNNIRILAELHARWEREEREAEIAKNSKVANVCTIYTNEDIKMLNAQDSSTSPSLFRFCLVSMSSPLPLEMTPEDEVFTFHQGSGGNL